MDTEWVACVPTSSMKQKMTDTYNSIRALPARKEDKDRQPRAVAGAGVLVAAIVFAPAITLAHRSLRRIASKLSRREN